MIMTNFNFRPKLHLIKFVRRSFNALPNEECSRYMCIYVYTRELQRAEEPSLVQSNLATSYINMTLRLESLK